MSPSETAVVPISSPLMNPPAEQKSLPHIVTPTLPVAAPTALLEVKDRRAFEHDRQRAHRPFDRYNSKLKRAPRRYVGNSGHSEKASHGYHATLRPWRRVVSKEDMDVGDGRDYSSQDGDELRIVDDEPVRPLHVSLSDLIRPPRKRNGISQGFEFIPRLRPVMIIEDGSEFGHEEEDDTLDWEVVRVPGMKREVSARQSTPKKSSYAAVLRASSIAKT